jgi:hypothetical protein
MVITTATSNQSVSVDHMGLELRAWAWG